MDDDMSNLDERGDEPPYGAPMNETILPVAHVYTAIAEVISKLSKEGIGKDRTNEQQRYKFRGIDDVYNAVAPYLAECKLNILPRYTDRTLIERESKNGGALFYVTVIGEFDFVSAIDGSKHTVGPFYGEAMDSGDKATNKAMSAAYKYACMQAFCIPTEGDNDADAKTHEVKRIEPVPVSVEAQRVAETIVSVLETDVEENIKALHVLDIIDKLNRDQDSFLAGWALLNSKTRSAWNKYKEMGKKLQEKPMNATGRAA